jgi:hypothetical protein
MGFEPMIPVFERAKTVHALDRAATVIGELHVLIATNIYNRVQIGYIVMQVMGTKKAEKRNLLTS